MRRQWIVIVLAAQTALASVVRPAAAEGPTAEDIDTAKSALSAGRALRAKGEHARALDEFRAAWLLVPTPITGIELARECIALDLLVDARETALAIAKLPVKANEVKLHADARAEADAIVRDLKDKIPRVTIKLVDPPADVHVEIDGKELNAATLLVPRSMNPGKHKVVAHSGASQRVVEFVLKAGDKSEVSVSFVEGVAKATASPATSSKSPVTPAFGKTGTTTNSWRTVGWITAGVGVATAGLGAYFALSGKSDFDAATSAHCGAAVGGRDGECVQIGLDERDAAENRNRLGIALLVTGGALAAGGITLWALSPSARDTSTAATTSTAPTLTKLSLSPTGLVLGGSF
jgi:hypothetical protein